MICSPLNTEELTSFCASKPIGRYPIGNDCKRYIYCFMNIGIVAGSVFSCEGATLLNPITLVCGTGFTCPPAEEVTTTEMPMTEEPTTLQPTTLEPTTVAMITKAIAPQNAFCVPKAVGRYPVVGTACKQYIYCYLYKDEKKGQVYSCAGTTMFHPTTLECVPSFKCTA